MATAPDKVFSAKIWPIVEDDGYVEYDLEVVALQYPHAWRVEVWPLCGDLDYSLRNMNPGQAAILAATLGAAAEVAEGRCVVD